MSSIEALEFAPRSYLYMHSQRGPPHLSHLCLICLLSTLNWSTGWDLFSFNIMIYVMPLSFSLVIIWTNKVTIQLVNVLYHKDMWGHVPDTYCFCVWAFCFVIVLFSFGQDQHNYHLQVTMTFSCIKKNTPFSVLQRMPSLKHILNSLILQSLDGPGNTS